jgi:hypothetical protein
LRHQGKKYQHTETFLHRRTVPGKPPTEAGQTSSKQHSTLSGQTSCASIFVLIEPAETLP